MSATYAGMSSYDGLYQPPAYGHGFYAYELFDESFTQPHNGYCAPVSFPAYPQQAYPYPPVHPWPYVPMPTFAEDKVVTTPYQHPASFQPPPQASFQPSPPASFQPPSRAWRPREPRTKILVGTPCAVCDDTASGYCYGVASCLGCKNFFRLTIITGDAARIRCQYAGTCVVTKKAKDACRQCRFTKCLLAGMALGGKRDRHSTMATSPPSTGRSKVLDATSCTVCSNIATGYHYDVALCQVCLDAVDSDKKEPVPSGKRRMHAPTTVFNEHFRYGNAVLTKFL